MAEWFAPKRYGYGSGAPIAWQGWLVLGAYLAVVVGATQINLFWTKNSANEDGFRVQRVNGANFNTGTNLREFVLPNGTTEPPERPRATRWSAAGHGP